MLCNVMWNGNINKMVTKASKRLYILRVLKQAGIPCSDQRPPQCLICFDTLSSGVLLCHLVKQPTCLS